MDKLDSVAASQVVSACLTSSLVRKLIESGVLSDEDARDVYEGALIDAPKQGGRPFQPIYEAVREMIKAHLQHHGQH